MIKEERRKNTEKLKEMRDRGMKVGSLVEIAFSDEDLHFDDMPGGGHFVYHCSLNGKLKIPNVSYVGYVINIGSREGGVLDLVNSLNKARIESTRLTVGIKVYGNAIQRYRVIPE